LTRYRRWFCPTPQPHHPLPQVVLPNPTAPPTTAGGSAQAQPHHPLPQVVLPKLNRTTRYRGWLRLGARGLDLGQVRIGVLPRFEEVAVGFHGLFVLALLFPCSGDAVQREARVWKLFELFLIRFVGFFKPSGADQCAAQHLQRRTRILRGLGVSEFFLIFAG